MAPPKQTLVSLILLLMMAQAMLGLSAAQESPTPTPAIQGYRGSGERATYRGAFADLAIEIDRFWAKQFQEGGDPYAPPDIIAVEQFMMTPCGPVEPVPNAFYCPGDHTIYLVPEFLEDQEREFGDFAPIAVLSHEWGHHIQALLAIIGTGPPTKASELQADCLMGAFTRHADDNGLLDYGDFMEALGSAIDAGDDTFLPEDAPGAHGLPEERVKALTRGFGGGPVIGCALPFGADVVISTVEPPVRQPSPSSIPSAPTPPPASVPDSLPRSLPLAHAPCFRIEQDTSFTFDDLVLRLGGTAEARALLQEWGWQSSANRIFACDTPPDGEAGWIDVSLHVFANPVAARAAVDYFAAKRTEGTSLTNGPPPQLGDYSVALSGPATNGNEFTIYASQGLVLLRVTGVSPSGIPFGNVLAVARAVLAGSPAVASTRTTAPAALPATAYLPSAPAVNYAECFRALARGTYSYGEVAAALAGAGLTTSQVDDLGWVDGAYVVFACSSPPFGRANQIDVVVHQFRDSQLAHQAMRYVSNTYVPGSSEARRCDSTGPLVVCVTGRSVAGSPLSDVQFVLQQVLRGAG